MLVVLVRPSLEQLSNAMKFMIKTFYVGIMVSVLIPTSIPAIAKDETTNWVPFFEDGIPRSTVWRTNGVGKGEICVNSTKLVLIANLERIDQVTDVYSKTDWETYCNIIVKPEGGTHREELTMIRPDCEALYDGTKGFKMRLELVDDHVCEFERID